MFNMNQPLRQVGAVRTAVAIAVLVGMWLPSAQAQQAVPEASGATFKFAINGFQLTGDIPLSSEETTRVLAPFIGTGTLETLQQATSALEAELKAKGFALHRVSLPPQEMGDKVTLTIVKFVIGKITVEGHSRYSEANLRASVPELREGQAPNFKVLAVQTTIANENPGKQIQVALKESDEADKIDAKLLVKEASPWSFSASVANTGSEATGQDRLSLVAGHSNVLDRDHQLSAAYTTSMERSKDVKQLGLNYRIPLYSQGGVLGLSYTNSDVVGTFGAFTSTGAGQTFGLNYSHYLAPVGGRRSFLSLALDEKQFNASKINAAPLALGQPDMTSSRPLTLGYTVRVESDNAAWGYNTELAFNVPGDRGNSLEDYQTSTAGTAARDVRIQSAHWTAVRGGANYLAPFADGWLWSVRGQFQYSADALISGEQFGLGGVTSVRGVADRAISGDQGVLASLEVSTPELQPGLRLQGFVDAGWLGSNNTSVVNSSKMPTDQLASTGLGLRFNTNSYSVAADWGRVIRGATPAVVGLVVPKTGDDKLHINLSARF